MNRDHASKPLAITAVSPARRRRLGPTHFAFVEGGPRLVASTLKWIRTEFAAAAKEMRFGTARLLRLDAAGIGARALRLPSLVQHP